MMKKAIITGVLVSLLLLVGCNAEPKEVVLEDSENEKNETDVSSESNLLTELQDEIIKSIKDQTELDKDSIETVMVSGNTDDLTVSVSFLKDVKVDDEKIQQIVKESIKKVSETEDVTINEEDTTIKIEKN